MDDLARDRRLAELQALDAPALADALDRLEQRGADRRAPLPFTLARALHARLDGLAPAVAVHVRRRLAAALDDCEAALEARRPVRAAPRAPGGRASPLAGLNAHIRQATAQPEALATELASAARFRQALARQQALQRTEQAQARKPRNAGPLNSHAIALECLAQMQALSPAYLQQFLQQVEALQWLEHLQGQPLAQPAGKGASGTPAGTRTTARVRAAKGKPGKG